MESKPLADMTERELLTQYALEDTKRRQQQDSESSEAWMEQARYGNELCQRGYLVTSGPRYAKEDEEIDYRYPRKKFDATNYRDGKEPLCVNERGEQIESLYEVK